MIMHFRTVCGRLLGYRTAPFGMIWARGVLRVDGAKQRLFQGAGHFAAYGKPLYRPDLPERRALYVCVVLLVRCSR